MGESAGVEPSLASARRELEEIDRAIVLLIAARLDVACSAIRIRARNGGNVEDPAQEAVVLRRARDWAEEAGISPSAVETVFRAIVRAGKDRYTALGSTPRAALAPSQVVRGRNSRVRSRPRPTPESPISPVSAPT